MINFLLYCRKLLKIERNIMAIVKYNLRILVKVPSKMSGLNEVTYMIEGSGEDLIYFSPEEKNSVNYNKSYNTGNFWCSKDDIIKISILDFDNGPFNTEDDIIDTWTGNISDLTSSDFSAAKFQNLSSIKIKASIHD